MGTPEAYNSIHEGPAIDAAVTRASEGGAIDAAIQAKPNPNLLDNWYFGNPVNQRGISSGTGPANAYGIDRWRFLGAGTLTIGSDYIAIASDGNPYALQQFIEPGRFAGVIGRTATLSALVKGNGRLKTSLGSSNIGAYSDYFSYSDWTLVQMQGTIVSGTDYYIFVQARKGSGNLYIKAVKLELGSQQTLAHQDADGNLVLNEIPDYGEQLRRCQRYYLSNKQRNAYGKSTSATTAYVDIPTPVTMRALPAIETGVIGHVVCNGVKTAIASINPVKLNDESITLQLVLNTSVSVDYPVFLTDTKYALSADL